MRVSSEFEVTGARAGECHRQPAPGRPWAGTRRSGPARPPRRREPRRRSQCRPPPLGSQPLDLLRQAAGGQAGIALHAGSVVENTTFGSSFQIAAHSSIESSSDGSWSAVSQYSIVSYSPRPSRSDVDLSYLVVTKRKTSWSGAVQSKPPSARRCSRPVRHPSNRSRCASEVLLGNGFDIRPPDAAELIALAGQGTLPVYGTKRILQIRRHAEQQTRAGGDDPATLMLFPAF